MAWRIVRSHSCLTRSGAAREEREFIRGLCSVLHNTSVAKLEKGKTELEKGKAELKEGNAELAQRNAELAQRNLKNPWIALANPRALHNTLVMNTGLPRRSSIKR